MNIPQPSRVMLDGITEPAKRELLVWLNTVTAALKDLDARLTDLEGRS